MSKKSKDIISNTFVDLLERYDFNKITISEICDNTSLVRKTFYNNFSTKEEVIAYVVEKLVLEYHASVNDLSVHSPLEISYLFFCFGKKNENIMTLLIKNNLFHLFRASFEKHLPTINNQIPNNKYNVLSNDDLSYVFAFHTTGVLRMLELWIENGFNKSPREMSQIYSTIISGVQDLPNT